MHPTSFLRSTAGSPEDENMHQCSTIAVPPFPYCPSSLALGAPQSSPGSEHSMVLESQPSSRSPSPFPHEESLFETRSMSPYLTPMVSPPPSPGPSSPPNSRAGVSLPFTSAYPHFDHQVALMYPAQYYAVIQVNEDEETPDDDALSNSSGSEIMSARNSTGDTSSESGSVSAYASDEMDMEVDTEDDIDQEADNSDTSNTSDTSFDSDSNSAAQSDDDDDSESLEDQVTSDCENDGNDSSLSEGSDDESAFEMSVRQEKLSLQPTLSWGSAPDDEAFPSTSRIM